MKRQGWLLGIALSALNFSLGWVGGRAGGRSTSDPNAATVLSQSWTTASDQSTQHARSVPTRTPPRATVPATLDELTTDLQNPSPQIVASALRKIRRQPTRETARAALATVQHTDPNVSAMATAVIAKAYAEGLIETGEIANAIEHSDRLPEKTQFGLYRALATKPTQEATTMLADLAQSGPVGLRRSAVLWLAACDRNVALPALLAALRDTDEYVRDQARQSLVHLSDGPDLGLDRDAWQRWFSEHRS